MASAGVNHPTFNWNLYLQLKQQFPEVSDGFVKDCLIKYTNDEQTCINRMREESERRLYEQPTAQLEQAMDSVQISDARRRNSFSHVMRTPLSSSPVPHSGRVPDGLGSQNQFPHSNSTPSLNVDYRQPSANTNRRYTGAQTAPVIQQGAPTFYNPPYVGGQTGATPPYGVPQMQNWIGNQGYPGGVVTSPGRPHSADSSNNDVTMPLYINIGYIPSDPYDQTYLVAPGGGSGRSSPAVPALQHQLSSASQHSASSATHRQLSRSSTGSRHSGHSDDHQVPSPLPQYVGPPLRPSVLDLHMVPFYLNEDLDNTTPGEDPAYVRALVSHQRSRMDQLMRDINVLRSKIARIKQEITHKEHQLLDRGRRQMSQPKATASVEEMKKLRETNRSLAIDIQYMTREIDLYTTGQLPLGIIDPTEQANFFRHMLNTGQTGPVPPPSVPPPSGNRSVDPPPVPPRVPLRPPHRPPPPPPPPPPAEDEGREWSCSYCTFINHPDLDKCEICEMPKHTAPVGPPVASRPPAGPARPLSAPGTSTPSYTPPVGSSSYLQLPPGYSYPPVARSTSHPPPSYTVTNPSGHMVDGSVGYQPTQGLNPAPPVGRMLCTRTESGEWELVNP